MRGMPVHARRDMVTIQQRAAGSDGYGQPSGGWTTLATVWAMADQVRGAEVAAGSTEIAATLVRFRVAKRSDVTTGMRVVWRSKAHDIEALVEVGRDLDIIARQGVGDAA